ncbi:MAG: hypothetical protein WA996_06965 [Candidatus Promineifilaceae bacterium]
MKIQIDIEDFQRLLGSTQESGYLLVAIRELTDLNDTEDLYKEVKGFHPLGPWSGWSW